MDYIGVGATIKHHPYVAGGVALGGLFLLIVLMRSGGGSGASSNAGTLQTIAAANAQQSQLAAQYGLQHETIASSNQQAYLAAQVQNNQSLAAADSARYQTDASLIAALAANQSQQQATQAQLAATAMQVNLQGQQNYLQADVTNQQTAAQLAALGIQSDASLRAAGMQYDATTAQQKLMYDVQQHQMDTQAAMYGMQIESNNLQKTLENQAYMHQLDTSLSATENTNAANLSAYTAGVGYQSMLAQLQAMLTGKGIDAQKDVMLQQGATDQQMQYYQYNYATQQSQNQYNIDNQIVGMVGQAGLNHGTTNLENALVSVLAGVMNQPEIGIAAQQSAASQKASSASMWSSITDSIARLGASVGAGLFNPVATVH
jgi:hypothetical protein